ncbi:IclR family transcriptional regulator [Cerasicoccus frondis]|uniref:IclR family transcriptional regulator n=1 Tax=Cerasicoccus frondis TaxID=490090 RepID=UPI002852CC44|nr:IclR family transcriptional regulator C-terminal domain-containing protein [Cerasicoccus frondis]
MMRETESPLGQGIAIIRLMVQSGHSWGVTALAQEMGMHKSSTYRLLQVLISLGFVEKIPETRRYTLCADIFDFIHEIAWNFGRNLSMDKRLREAAAELKCSVYLNMLGKRDSYIICGAGDEGNTTRLGSHARAYATSAGKVLIAHRDESTWENYAPALEDKSSLITPYTNIDKQRFFAELREVRKRGIAWNHRECSVAHVSLATIVHEPFIQQPRLAVAFLIPQETLRLRDDLELEHALLELATDLQRKLGWHAKA